MKIAQRKNQATGHTLIRILLIAATVSISLSPCLRQHDTIRVNVDLNVISGFLPVQRKIEVKPARRGLKLHAVSTSDIPGTFRPTRVAPRQRVRLLIASLSPEQLFHGQASRNNSDGTSFDCRLSSGHRVQFADDTLGTTWLVRNA